MEKTLRDKDGLGSRTIDFGEDCYRLDFEKDIEPLLAKIGKLSSDAMDWFRVWYLNKVKDLRMKICIPFFNELLKDWKNAGNGESHSSIQHFCRTKAGFWGIGNTLLVPIVGYNHWSLVVMSDTVFLHFDSHKDAGIHSFQCTQ
jgi:hypothetical protein